MSKRTYIPQWNPHSHRDSSFTNTRRYNRAGGNRNAKNVFGNRMMNITSRTVYHPKARRDREDRSPPRRNQDYHRHRDEERRYYRKERSRSPVKGGHRITQRVGMFRNAKHSDVVFNNDIDSSSVRERVQRKIDRIIAPENEVEWTRNTTSTRYKSKEQGVDYDRRRYTSEEEHYQDHLPRHYRPKYGNSEQNQGRRSVDLDSNSTCDGYEDPMRIVPNINNNDYDVETDALLSKRERRKIVGENEKFATDMSKPPPSVSNTRKRPIDYNTNSTSMRAVRETATTAISRQSEIDDYNIPRKDDLAALAARQERKMMTPKKKPDRIPSPELVSVRIPYDSKEYVNKLFSALPFLPLGCNENQSYSSVAVGLLSQSIRNASQTQYSVQPPECSLHSSRLMRSLMDQTIALAAPSDENFESMVNGQKPKSNDNLFTVDDGDVINSPTDPHYTMSLERLFNQTVLQTDALDDDEASQSLIEHPMSPPPAYDAHNFDRDMTGPRSHSNHNDHRNDPINKSQNEQQQGLNESGGTRSVSSQSSSSESSSKSEEVTSDVWKPLFNFQSKVQSKIDMVKEVIHKHQLRR